MVKPGHLRPRAAVCTLAGDRPTQTPLVWTAGETDLQQTIACGPAAQGGAHLEVGAPFWGASSALTTSGKPPVLVEDRWEALPNLHMKTEPRGRNNLSKGCL